MNSRPLSERNGVGRPSMRLGPQEVHTTEPKRDKRWSLSKCHACPPHIGHRSGAMRELAQYGHVAQLKRASGISLSFTTREGATMRFLSLVASAARPAKRTQSRIGVGEEELESSGHGSPMLWTPCRPVAHTSAGDVFSTLWVEERVEAIVANAQRIDLSHAREYRKPRLRRRYSRRCG